MPIPKNILQHHILSAIEQIDQVGIPDGRESRKFNLVYQEQQYPPKYVLSIANFYANGSELAPSEFSGGDEANGFLIRLGFTVVENENNTHDSYELVVGQYYSRKDIYRIVKVPEAQQGGNWDTGYTRYNGNSFIFANVGTAGRTGHDHPNAFDGDDLIWFGKDGSKLRHASIQSMINSQNKSVYIFVREDSSDTNFLFLGKGTAKEYEDSEIGKVRIKWSFDDLSENHPERLSEEVNEPEKYYEGALKQVHVNVYERNPLARKRCIEHYGLNCMVCGFNFKSVFGYLGKDFIHVHHLTELHLIGSEYVIDPIRDLRPVCPNCHAMLHKRKPAYSIVELRNIIQHQRDKFE
ncbi:DUF3427 domain-containing protein [Paenibacillus sp. MMO-58]|uniref:DUF3427 domain-containing protein n=1 Tax=Paenibacillus sp. MMO-58 TaxID=3081290 RepID=UPI003019C72B